MIVILMNFRALTQLLIPNVQSYQTLNAKMPAANCQKISSIKLQLKNAWMKLSQRVEINS